jgi:hypothetical protein
MGGDFLRNASLQRRELVSHFEINYVRLGVRLTMAHLLHWLQWSRWIGIMRENILLYP